MHRANFSSNMPRVWWGAVALAIVLMQPLLGVAYGPYRPATRGDWSVPGARGEQYCASEPYYTVDPYFAGEPCGAGYPPPSVISALDMPLTWYFMPRRAGCPSHDYRYRVEVPEPFPADCGGCGQETGEPCLGDAGTRCGGSAPELVDGFAPVEFERLGQIPNDSLLEAAAGQ